MIPEGSRIQGVKGSSENTKELQRFESLAKVLRTLFRDIYNNRKIPKLRNIRSDFTDKKICCVYSFEYGRRIWKKDNLGLHSDALHILGFCLRIGNTDIIRRRFRFN